MLRRIGWFAGFVFCAPGCASCDGHALNGAPVVDGGTATTPATSSAIPSPDIVANASMQSDAGSTPAIPTGTFDGAVLRATNRARLARDRSPVVILRGGTALDLGERLCNAVVPLRPADTPVLIKPNIGGFDAPKDPAKNGGDDGVKWRTTGPEFVRGVIHCLKARGHTHITIANGFGAGHALWDRVLRTSGYGEMARQENVPIVAMDDDGVFDVGGDQPGKPMKVTGMEKTSVPTLLVPKVLAQHLEHGLFLSLPKIKTHRFAVFSLGIKGMQGTVMLSDAAPAHAQKSRMHRELMKALADQKNGAPGARPRVPPPPRCDRRRRCTRAAHRRYDTRRRSYTSRRASSRSSSWRLDPVTRVPR